MRFQHFECFVAAAVLLVAGASIFAMVFTFNNTTALIVPSNHTTHKISRSAQIVPVLSSDGYSNPNDYQCELNNNCNEEDSNSGLMAGIMIFGIMATSSTLYMLFKVYFYCEEELRQRRIYAERERQRRERDEGGLHAVV